MTERVKKFKELVLSGEYKSSRRDHENRDITEKVKNVPEGLRRTVLFETMLEREVPFILDGDIFGFNRTLKTRPVFFREDGRKATASDGNITPNYIRVINSGFDAILEKINEYDANVFDGRKLFYEAMRRDILAVIDLSERYRISAEEQGNKKLADALSRVPRKPAESFYEACVFFKIIVFTLRASGMIHTTIGRFDQYMYPFIKRDLERGVSRDELFETLEMLFVSLNIDSDLYTGIQQGDNGQSMVLGGYDKDGNDLYNELSEMCMEASLELCLIDPKINLRVNKTTPDSRYEYATKLTKKGLGFPQYCNDDVAVPFLISMGYEEKDALDYTVAACWEYIVPNCAFDIPNRVGMNFPLEVDRAVRTSLTTCKSFDELLSKVNDGIKERADEYRKKFSPFYNPSLLCEYNQYLSLYVDGCLEKGLDIRRGGAKYNNDGCHGVGIANAADALFAIKEFVFDKKEITPEELIAALDANFEGYSELRNKLLCASKMGNNDDRVDSLAACLMDMFVNNLSGKPNDRFGGVWRAGTGSAMQYITSAAKCGATADGRRAYEPFSSSFSPSITAKTNGPLSVVQSFTKYDFVKIANGGPLTMELHDTVFRNEEGEKKVAQLVKAYIMLGGHQLQLNSINRDRLLEAQADPDRYPNLIVRVWGWSGYFRELDREYQDHIIKRTEFSF